MIEGFIYKYGKKIKITLVTIFVVIWALIIGYAGVCAKNNKDVTFFGYKPYFIVSGSMEPAINTWSIVFGEPVDLNNIKEGDIISYERLDGTKTVIHRVIRINDDGTYTFKGDNNKSSIPSDIGVTKEQLRYKIVKF